MKFAEIAALVDPEDEVFFYDPEDDLAAILDAESHIKRMWKFVDGEFEEINVDIPSMAIKLKEGLNVEMFLEEVLKTSTPAELLEIRERLENLEASVKSAPRCFALMIGGKKGAPFELTLRR